MTTTDQPVEGRHAGIIVGGISLGGIDLPATRPPLHQRAERLDITVDRVDEAIKALLHRLEPVLAPSQPTPSSETAGNDRGDDSWLAGFLGHVTAKLEELEVTVQRITARVDL